jgi:hypothetical protein
MFESAQRLTDRLHEEYCHASTVSPAPVYSRDYPPAKNLE